MKLILCILILICFLYLGVGISKNYYKKLTYTDDFKNFIEYLRMNVSYANKNIEQLINSYSFKSELLKKDLLKYKEIMFKDIDKINEIIITKDNEILIDFLTNFGKYDKESTIKYCDKFIFELEKIKTYLKSKENERGVLPIKLSLLFGAFICLMCI